MAGLHSQTPEEAETGRDPDGRGHILQMLAAGYAELPEPRLVELARRDPDAFGELYRRTVERIYTYIYYRTGNVADAEDLTARTFHQALSNIHRYTDQGVPFIAWLYRIAHNLVANHHRSRSRWRTTPLDDLELTGKPAENPERAAEANERKQALWSAIRRQPEDRQRLLILKFADRLSNEEIGQLMGRTESSIKSLYFRTLKALKADLEARGW
ncbi:MAG: ECF RNA polymerase sigma factor SigW [Chloroflexi bacterium ADurb.Bin325]|nr:MAG: ECF RNA polymerase sigma factor SigW [Chloroflexi bacterium ADurb.Bin325]